MIYMYSNTRDNTGYLAAASRNTAVVSGSGGGWALIHVGAAGSHIIH